MRGVIKMLQSFMGGGGGLVNFMVIQPPRKEAMIIYNN